MSHKSYSNRPAPNRSGPVSSPLSSVHHHRPEAPRRWAAALSAVSQATDNARTTKRYTLTPSNRAHAAHLSASSKGRRAPTVFRLALSVRASLSRRRAVRCMASPMSARHSSMCRTFPVMPRKANRAAIMARFSSALMCPTESTARFSFRSVMAAPPPHAQLLRPLPAP